MTTPGGAAPPSTPGQRAYEAYHQGAPLPWALLPAWEQHQWEAAAQAVLTAFVQSTRPIDAQQEAAHG